MDTLINKEYAKNSPLCSDRFSAISLKPPFRKNQLIIEITIMPITGKNNPKIKIRDPSLFFTHPLMKTRIDSINPANKKTNNKFVPHLLESKTKMQMTPLNKKPLKTQNILSNFL